MKPGRPSSVGTLAIALVIGMIAAGAGPIGCGANPDNRGAVTSTVDVFAAASLVDVLEALEKNFEAANPTINVRLNVASSSTLAKQILAGAPADIFISANVNWMDELERAGQLRAETRFDLAGNQLVVIVPANVGISVSFDPAADPRAQLPLPIAIGEPDHVPAGIYAKQALTRLGWWEAVERDCVGAVDVRAAVNFVEQGRCKSGIVYASDAAAVPAVKVAATFPAKLHNAIMYPAARIAGTQANPAADKFFAALRTPEAQALLAKFGFTAVPTTETGHPK